MVCRFEALTGVTAFSHHTKACVIPVLSPQGSSAENNVCELQLRWQMRLMWSLLSMESKCGYFPGKQQFPLANAVSEIDGPAERCEKLQVSSFFHFIYKRGNTAWSSVGHSHTRQLAVTLPRPPDTSCPFCWVISADFWVEKEENDVTEEEWISVR